MLNFVRQLFLTVDKDGSGTITWEEFLHSLDSEEMCLFFESMDLDIQEAQGLYQLLDMHGRNELTYEDFVHGCFRLRGAAKAIDLASLMMDYKRVSQKLDDDITKVKSEVKFVSDLLRSRFG